jgi:5-(carboxyamino)imidazole ribonucleotide synthase
LKPGATLGVLGGGQLGRMWSHAAQALGFRTAVLDPDPHSPAGLVSHLHVCADYLNAQALAQMASQCQAITTEFENVPSEALRQLGMSLPCAPGSEPVSVAQDRALEKAHFVQCGVPVAPHQVLHSAADMSAVPASLLPGILKTTRLGYDGKGQVRVASLADLPAAWQQLQAQGPAVCILEKRLSLAAECSVVLARGFDGQMVHLPLQVNLHRDGILAVTEVFAGNVPDALAQQAVTAAKAVAQELNYVGVLCVEFFVLADNALVVNEIAPRPHNSGHYSQDACDVSQFELQVRTMADLPLTQPRLHSSAIMLNLLGDLWWAHASGANASQVEPAWQQVLALPGTHLHLYGKHEARVGRKMGHLNITAATPEAARDVALQAAAILGIAPF